MKLKTLNDLCIYNAGDVECDSEEIKQEAIKWVKELRLSPDFFKGTSEDDADAMIKWIKFFFNITEEDLK